MTSGVVMNSSNNANASLLPPLCFFHYQLKTFMDSSPERAYGDSNNFLPKKAPNVPKNVTLDALAKYEIITKNLGLSENNLNIITNNNSPPGCELIAPPIYFNESERDREIDSDDSSRPHTNHAANNASSKQESPTNRSGTRGGLGSATTTTTKIPSGFGGVGGSIALTKQNLSKTLSDRSRDMYIIRAASSLLQELWDGKLKGTLQVFMKKVISEFNMKARLEAKLNSYKNSMVYFTNRAPKLIHPVEAILVASHGKKQPLNNQKGVGLTNPNLNPNKVSPRGKKVMFQSISVSNTSIASTVNSSSSSIKFRTHLPTAPKWTVWKTPKRAATVIEMQLELERDYIELLRKENEVVNELKHFLAYKFYPTTEINVIRKEQKLLKETVDIKIENQELLSLMIIAPHFTPGNHNKIPNDDPSRENGEKNDASSNASNDGLNPFAISPALLANTLYYQSLKQLALLESGMTEKKMHILTQKRLELDENMARSAIQQQKMLQALKADKIASSGGIGIPVGRGDGNGTGKKPSKAAKDGVRPDPASFSMHSRF